MMRTRQDSDEAELAALYDGEIPRLFCECVLVEDGRIVGHGGVRMVPEVVLALAKGHPAAKLHRLRVLQQALLGWLNETGQHRAIALIAPKIERGFLRRLKILGWQEGVQSAIFVRADEGFRGQK